MRDVSLIRWLFAPPDPPGVVRSILWWERRRIPVNVLLGLYGIVCLVIFFVALARSTRLQPGEDAIEPAVLVLVPVAFNVCYTFGWLVEASARLVAPRLTPKLGPGLLLAGLILSACVIGFPAAFWGGYFVLHVIGVV